MATGTITLDLVYGKVNARLKNVPSDISLANLRTRAAKKLPITGNQMTFQYFEDGKWFVWDEDDGLTDGQELKVVRIDESGNIIEEEFDGTEETNPNDQVGSRRQDASVAAWVKKIESKLQENKQGIVFIVGMSDAKGSEKDILSMQQVFAKLNFALFLEHNLNAEDMKDLAQAIAKYPFPARIYYKYIAFYYAGHGGISRNGDAVFKPVQDSDEKEFVFIERDVIRPIENGQRNKCLLFFFDCCLSNAKGIAEDATPDFVPTHPNSLVAYASSFGKTSSGDYKTGGKWTQTLCKHLEENDSLASILDRVSIEVNKEYGQKSTFKHNLTTPVNLKATVKPEEKSLLKKAPDQEHAVTLLANYTHEYDKIGRALGIKYADRNKIKFDQNSPRHQDKLNDTVDTWITKETSDVTWEHFIEAMKAERLMQLAGQIQSFLQQDDTKQFYAKQPEWTKGATNN